MRLNVICDVKVQNEWQMEDLETMDLKELSTVEPYFNMQF